MLINFSRALSPLPAPNKVQLCFWIGTLKCCARYFGEWWIITNVQARGSNFREGGVGGFICPQAINSRESLILSAKPIKKQTITYSIHGIKSPHPYFFHWNLILLVFESFCKSCVSMCATFAHIYSVYSWVGNVLGNSLDTKELSKVWLVQSVKSKQVFLLKHKSQRLPTKTFTACNDASYLFIIYSFMDMIKQTWTNISTLLLQLMNTVLFERPSIFNF